MYKQQYTNDTELFYNTENEILLLINFLPAQIILNYLLYLHLFWYTRLYSWGIIVMHSDV